MLVRLQRQDQSWIWLYIRVTLDRSRDVIVCTNHAVSEAEAVYLRDKLYGAAQMSQPSCVPRDCDPLRRSSETGADSLPFFFSTPPYSPTSSHCSSDFLSEGSGALCLPQPISDPFSPALGPADAHLVPVYSVCKALEEFGVFLTPEPSPPAEGPLLYSEVERGQQGPAASTPTAGQGPIRYECNVV